MEQNEQLVLAVERTRLAAERTLLSWIRTGLAGLGGGVAVVRLITYQTDIHRWIAYGVGQSLILWSALIFIYALISYRKSCQKLEESQEYKHSLQGITFLISALIIFTFLILMIN